MIPSVLKAAVFTGCIVTSLAGVAGEPVTSLDEFSKVIGNRSV